MPSQRTGSSSVKPVITKRTQEENRERAYIAASRRSDRTLEARVESARRASEIHKRRTGRSLRVTEQHVVNEEMYEEEDVDLPTRYRRLTAHLQTQSAEFNQRFQAYVVNGIAMRQAVGHATADTMQAGNNRYKPNDIMQMSRQQRMRRGMPPPQMYHTSPANYRQQPYLMPQNNQAVRQNYHSQSTAQPTAQTKYQPHHSQSDQISSVEARSIVERRTLLAAQNMMPQTPVSYQRLLQSPVHHWSPRSRRGLSTDLAVGHNIKPESTHQVATAPENRQQQPQPWHQQSLTSPFSINPKHQLNDGMNPFTMQLPMEAQQVPEDAWPHDLPIASQTFSQSSYSYNPNGNMKRNTMQQGPHLCQTLMQSSMDAVPTGLDESSVISPYSALANTGFSFIPQTLHQWGFGSNQDVNAELFKDHYDVLDDIGQITPHDDGWLK
ncbi:hypothetical protein LTR78_010475 [Recurvomyces mirabilis]|uniref:Uncharacterized protein n=1 Tax=Recurvomyces mirabilis TaxID=574656 RepID=A0AAE0TMA1_9PEZI|nr:hypothetical protein LTR78_010475 [Recurvomyces mirabilis]KAK5150368.1 hypothetical protein LTS14_010207 [Recurvomyces mirabilis]